MKVEIIEARTGKELENKLNIFLKSLDKKNKNYKYTTEF